MRKGLPFVLLALVIAALVVPVGSAVSLNASLDPLSQGPAWSVVTSASRVAVLSPRHGPAGPAPWLPEWGRLFLAGATLLGLSGVARRGR